jgi:adenine deaminase
LVSLRSIADIEFGISYTQIFLTNGGIVNVIENEKEITDMIRYQNGHIVGVEYLENLQARIDAYYEMEADRFAVGEDDELPF